MAAIPVTFVINSGSAPGDYPMTFSGEMFYTGLGVGGGPIIPGSPPGHPAFPIAGWPGSGFPDKPGYPPTVEHPIVIPPAPTTPPEDATIVKPPPPGGGWAWSPDYGWGYFPMSGGKPHPAPTP
jgi:hypothetical protein